MVKLSYKNLLNTRGYIMSYPSEAQLEKDIYFQIYKVLEGLKNSDVIISTEKANFHGKF